MCDPGTAMLGAAAVMATGSIVQGVSAKRQAGFQADLAGQIGGYQVAQSEETAQFYEELGEFNAEAALENARLEESQLRVDRKRKLSTIGVGQAAGGQLSGSSMDVLADQAMSAEREAQLIRYRGEVAAQQEIFTGDVLAHRERVRGMEALWTSQGEQSSLKARGRAAQTGGFFSAGSSLLSGIGAMQT